MTRFPIAVTLLFIVLLVAAVVPAPLSLHATSAALQPPLPGTAARVPLSEGRSTGTAHAVFVPSVTSDYRTRPPCSPESPFGLQIGSQLVGASGNMTAHSWEAYLQGEFSTLMEALEASGACWVRTGVRWRTIQPDPAEPYDWTYYDGILSTVTDTGVQLIATVTGVPGWAGPWERGPIYEERLGDFSQFLTDVVNRYKQPPYNIHTWELFNEPDKTASDPVAEWGDKGDEYAAMMAVAYPAIKAADPEATVLMGGIAYDGFTEYNGVFYRYFPDEVMEAGGGAYFDALNFHYYPDFHKEWERWVPHGNPPTCGDVEDGVGTPYPAYGIDVIAKTNHFLNRMQVCHAVEKAVWLTESSEHGYPDDALSLTQQARYAIQGNARALAAGIEVIIWFPLADLPNNDSGHGLLYKDDWSPKPAFFAYETLTYELAGYEYARTLDVDSVEGYVFQNAAQEEQTLAWSWGEPHVSGSLTFAPASRLRVVDRYGSASYIQDGGSQDADGLENGSITLELPSVPVDPDPTDHMRITADPLIISVW